MFHFWHFLPEFSVFPFEAVLIKKKKGIEKSAKVTIITLRVLVQAVDISLIKIQGTTLFLKAIQAAKQSAAILPYQTKSQKKIGRITATGARHQLLHITWQC